MVYPAWGDVKGEFVVEDCLQGGDDLWVWSMLGVELRYVGAGKGNREACMKMKKCSARRMICMGKGKETQGWVQF